MRQPRFTYEGAFHHGMNRGHNREDIFAGSKNKQAFLGFLGECAKLYRIRILAFCVMDNHHHLVLQNSSGRMSEFFRHLHTLYAFYYRRLNGGSGYVFQGRFQSTLIGGDGYLRSAIVYVLQNPLRAGMVDQFQHYLWSSGSLYSNKKSPEWLDVEFVTELFGGAAGLAKAVQTSESVLPVQKTVLGPVLGSEDELEQARSHFERRNAVDVVKRKRQNDFGFEPVEKVVWEFERLHGIKAVELSTSSIAGKRLRGELLVKLKDLAGLKYREIIELAPFSDLHFHSMAHLYQNAKKRNHS
jgi:REP element-mobilizing transposase RayT